jgi:hypothetical protein
MDTAHGLLATPAQVNAQVLDVMTVDTFTALTGVPPANTSFLVMAQWVHTLARNDTVATKTSEGTATVSVKADDGTTEVASSASTDDGTTATRGKYT